jgi:glycosyltransferase involved in cell wall biosynthesis
MNPRRLFNPLINSVMSSTDRIRDRWWNREPVATVAINRRPARGPWGGGNQWLDQIVKSLRLHGYSVRFDLKTQVDCILMADPRSGPTVTFDAEAIAAYKSKHPNVVCIHRVNDNDKHRGSNDRDASQADGNRVSDHTVFVSDWLLDYEGARWFDPARPHSVIVNGADTRTFHPLGGAPLTRDEPMRLVTHHWSDNWSKGFAVYAEIDRLISEGELPNIELWVIGRWPEEIRWRSARTFGAMGGAAIGQLLRQCHVYVTASQWESGPMHFIEGIQCGLPVLYQANGGGILEVAKRFGICFDDDIRPALREMRDGYTQLRQAVLAEPPSGDRMCLQYRTLVQRLIVDRRGTDT